jgi:biopolymer transport protein ExbD
MRFQRNAKIFRGRLDAAPLAGIFFLLLIFLLLASLVYTPGIPIQISGKSARAAIELPSAKSFAGTTNPTVVVAINFAGQFFFENQIIGEPQLKSRLTAEANQATSPLTLVVLADKQVAYDTIVRVTQLAEEAGITKALLQQRPVVSKNVR